jgi:hypothetical protein
MALVPDAWEDPRDTPLAQIGDDWEPPGEDDPAMLVGVE